MPILLFTHRYEEATKNKDFLESLLDGIRNDLYHVLMEFNEPGIAAASRYDSYTVNTNTLDEVSKEYEKCFHNSLLDDSYDQYGRWFYRLTDADCFSIIELWYFCLSSKEQPPFQVAINKILADYKNRWRLVDGRMMKIDNQQFEMDMQRLTLELLEEMKSIKPVFHAAYSELRNAMDAYEKSDYKQAIFYAGSSYESVLKIALEVTVGNADSLTKQLIESTIIDPLPVYPNGFSKAGFREKVLMSLPYMRNQLAGHGDGPNEIVISAPLARLAINAACALCSYVLESYAINRPCLNRDEESDDDLPF